MKEIGYRGTFPLSTHLSITSNAPALEDVILDLRIYTTKRTQKSFSIASVPGEIDNNEWTVPIQDNEAMLLPTQHSPFKQLEAMQITTLHEQTILLLNI